MITYFVLWCYLLIQGMAQIHRSSAFSKKAGRYRQGGKLGKKMWADGEETKKNKGTSCGVRES
jgi:hypothetical protein